MSGRFPMCDAERRRRREHELYEQSVGRPPVERVPEDHPDRWQWDYRGKRDEREELLERLDCDPVQEPPQEETLFGDAA